MTQVLQEESFIPNFDWISQVPGNFDISVRVTDRALYADDAGDDWATFTVHVVGINLRTDSNNDGTINQSDDSVEENAPGRIIAYNDDDDDSNGTADRMQTGQVVGENDQAGVELSYPSQSEASGYKIRLQAYGSNIRVWTSEDKTAEIDTSDPNQSTWTIGSGSPPPTVVWAEGSMPGTDWLHAYLKDCVNNTLSEDAVLFTVLDAEINIDGVQDSAEVIDGGVVVRRHDNNGAPRQKITLLAPSPAGQCGNVIMGFSSTKVKLYDSETGGTQITFNGTDNEFSPDVLPKDFWVEGVEASDSKCDVSVTAALKNHSSINDTIRLTIVDGDLDIDGVAEDDEDTIGAVVLRNYDGNNAPRKKIILQKAAPADWNGYLVLTRSSNKVNVFDAQTGGNEITFDGTDNKFSNSTLPKEFWVQGIEPSQAMRDVPITFSLDSPCITDDIIKLTVLWVNVTARHKDPATNQLYVSEDNAAKDYVGNLIVPAPPSEAGPNGTRIFHSVPLGRNLICYLTGHSLAMLSEFIGEVLPSDFAPSQFGGSMHLARYMLAYHPYYGLAGSTASDPADPRDDTSSPSYRDDDPQSGNSQGRIYDLDAPGYMRLITQPNEILRLRANFREYAVYDDMVCSNRLEWCTASSDKKLGYEDSGVSSSDSDLLVLRDTDTPSINWQIDQWVGGVCWTDENPRQHRGVIGNTRNTISVSHTWSWEPDEVSYSIISPMTWVQSDDIQPPSGQFDNKNRNGSTNTTWNLQP